MNFPNFKKFFVNDGNKYNPELLNIQLRYEQFSKQMQSKNTARLKGEFIEILSSILWWDIPKDLKIKIQEKIKELENEN